MSDIGKGSAHWHQGRHISRLETRVEELWALCQMQNRALEGYDKHTSGVMIPQTRAQGKNAIEAFKQYKENLL